MSVSAGWFWGAVALAVALGITFRLVHAETHLFWGDEAYTALRVSGHWDSEFREIFNGSTYRRADILQFQQFDPQRHYTDTVAGLATEEPQHAPLSFVLDRLWASISGSSIASLRAVAVLFGVVTIAAVYWLCLELSQGDVLAAGAGAALVAISPFFVNYGAQAREYSMFAAIAALASALLLRALRVRSMAAWWCYALAASVGLYSDILMACVLASHAIYVGFIYHKYLDLIKRYIAVSAVAVASFIPWIVICIHNWHAVSAWQAHTFVPYSLTGYFGKWAFNIAAVLFDAEYARLWLAPLALGALLLLVWATIALFREQPRAVMVFIVSLGLFITIEQVLPDVIFGGHESTTARYVLPVWLALVLALAMFFGKQRLAPRAGRLNAVAVGFFLVVLFVAAVSSTINSASVAWWDNDGEYPSILIAARINNSGPAPIVVSEGHWSEVYVLSHYVKPDVSFLLFNRHPPFPINVTSTMFLLDPSRETLAAFKRQASYQLDPIPFASLVSAASVSFHTSLQHFAEADHQGSVLLYRLRRGR